MGRFCEIEDISQSGWIANGFVCNNNCSEKQIRTEYLKIFFRKIHRKITQISIGTRKKNGEFNWWKTPSSSIIYVYSSISIVPSELMGWRETVREHNEKKTQ